MRFFKKKPKYITLDLIDGGEVTVLTEAAARATLSNPYPREARPERWRVIFNYDNHYDVTEACYNRVRNTLSVPELSPGV